MTVRGSTGAFLRHHACEFILFVVLAVPVVALRPFLSNILTAGGLILAIGVLGYLNDKPTRMCVDDDGVHYYAGGQDRQFVAWNEIGSIVPRRFRGWPAEDALVLRDRSGRPLLVAGVSMFEPAQLHALGDVARRHVEVCAPVRLSPFTARANGERRPDLVPERTSERFLASSVGGFLLAAVVGVCVVWIVER